MSSLAPNELVEFLTRNQMLSPGHLEALGREWPQLGTTVQISDDLVSRGWLTKYQQSQILAGKGDGLVLGPYRLLEPLGEGGMGLVYKGWHPRLDRFVALKLIRPQVLASRPEIVTRFMREARAIAQLHHPNVVLLYDADEVNGTHYIAMEFVDGITLEKMVRSNGPLAIKQACDYMRQSAMGLQHAHECGLVHRDIKPSNILVTQKATAGGKRSSTQIKRPALVTIRDRELSTENTLNGRSEHAWGIVKILDMGLARLQESLEGDEAQHAATPLTKAGALLGTPDFISPEQARDARNVDIRADLYSLGCTFYYCLSGRAPFPGGTDIQKLIKHQNEKPYPIGEVRPHLPFQVAAIVEKLMAKKVEERFQTPIELAEALAEYLNSTLSSHTPPRGTKATDPLLRVSPVPRSPLVNDAGMPLADIVDGFDSEVELPAGDELQESSIPAAAIAGAQPTGGGRPTTAHAVAPAHTGAVSALAVSADGFFAASGGVDGKIIVWDLGASPPRQHAVLPRPNTEIQSLSFAPEDPAFLVFGSSQRGTAKIMRWDWTENRVFDWGGFSTTDNRGVGSVCFAPDGGMFAAGVGNFAVTWKVNNRNPSAKNILKSQGFAVNALAFSPDHRLLVTGGEGRSLRFWGFGWLGTSLKATVQAPFDSISSIAFAADGKRLATAGRDRQVCLWDPLTPSENTVVALTGHKNNLKLVRFLPDGRTLVSVGESGEVFFWDYLTNNLVRQFQLDMSLAYSVAASSDGSRVVAGHTNGKVAFFQIAPNLAEVSPSPLLSSR